MVAPFTQLQVTGFIDIYVSLNRVVQTRHASVRELSAFHSLDYIECLKQVTNDDKCEEMEHVASEYGFRYDTCSTGPNQVNLQCVILLFT